MSGASEASFLNMPESLVGIFRTHGRSSRRIGGFFRFKEVCFQTFFRVLCYA